MLAYVGLQGLIAIGPSDLPRLQEISVHPPVLAFAVAVSLASTLVFGSITALKHALHIDTHVIGARARREREPRAERDAQRVGRRAGGARARVGRERGADDSLVSGLARHRSRFLGSRDDSNGDAYGTPAWPNVDPAESLQWTRTQHEILDRIAALPGVASAGFVNALPIEWSGTFNINGFAVEGRALAAGDERPQGPFKFISPGYFEAMGTRLIAGRGLTWSDIEAGGRVVVVSAEFARQLATEPAAALGLRIRFAGDDQGAWREVIGVVQSIHERGLYEEPPAMVYWPTFMADLSPASPRSERRSSRSPSAASAPAPRASWRRSGRPSGR